MSIAVVLKGKDAIVMATDGVWSEARVGTEEVYRHDNLQKLWNLQELWKLSHPIGLAVISNNVGLAEQLREELGRIISEHKLNNMGITEIAKNCAELANGFLNWLLPEPLLKLTMEYKHYMYFIFGGYDKDGNPHIGYFSHSAASLGFIPNPYPESMWIAGLSTIGNHLKKKVEMEMSTFSQTSLKRLAVVTILETHKIEPWVGERIQMLVIPQNGSACEVETSDLDKIKTYVRENTQDLDERLIEILKHS